MTSDPESVGKLMREPQWHFVKELNECLMIGMNRFLGHRVDLLRDVQESTGPGGWILKVWSGSARHYALSG